MNCNKKFYRNIKQKINLEFLAKEKVEELTNLKESLFKNSSYAQKEKYNLLLDKYKSENERLKKDVEKRSSGIKILEDYIKEIQQSTKIEEVHALNENQEEFDKLNEWFKEAKKDTSILYTEFLNKQIDFEGLMFQKVTTYKNKVEREKKLKEEQKKKEEEEKKEKEKEDTKNPIETVEENKENQNNKEEKQEEKKDEGITEKIRKKIFGSVENIKEETKSPLETTEEIKEEKTDSIKEDTRKEL